MSLLIRKIKKVMSAHEYDKCVWDGNELTFFASGVPWGYREFVANSETCKKMIELEIQCAKLKSFVVD